MRVVPTGQSEYYDGNEVGRYGQDLDAGREPVFVHYHDGIDGQPTWAMDADVAKFISVSVDTILVADAHHGLHAVDRSTFDASVTQMDGRQQCVASADDEWVNHLGDPKNHLRGRLWVESGNQVDENYHQEQGHA